MGLLLATSRHQATAWRLRSSKSSKVASGQEIVLDVGEGTLNSPFSVGMSDPVSAEAEAQGAGEGQHLGGDDGIGAGTGGEQDAGIVDDADRTDAVHEARRLEQERLGLEAGEARVVLNEQPARVSQHQSRRTGR